MTTHDIKICDGCLAVEEIGTPNIGYMNVRYQNLTIDLCKTCANKTPISQLPNLCKSAYDRAVALVESRVDWRDEVAHIHDFTGGICSCGKHPPANRSDLE